MAGARAAIRYAKAVLSLANDKKATEAVNDDMKLIVDSISQNEELSAMLQSPVLKSSVKKSALLEIFPKLNTISVNLIDTLIVNKRMPILGTVAAKYNQLFDELKGTQVAQVTTAVPLSNELKTKVLAKVKELTGKEAAIENTVDESIIGGFILRIGDIQYNASISNRINKLKREFSLN